MKPNLKNYDYIRFLKENDSEGIRLIYQKYFFQIYTMIQKRNGKMVDAEDVFQDALIIIYEKSKNKDFKLTSHFSTFLYGICLRLWQNKLQLKYRKNQSIEQCEELVDSFDIEASMHQNELKQILWSQFGKLTSNAQKVLLLVFEGKSMEEIRVIMGYRSVNYAAKRKFYCQQKLIKLIKMDTRYKEIIDLKKS